MKIYLAGPEVFLPDSGDLGRRKRELCARYGFTGLFPLDNQVDLESPDASMQIFRGNLAMMDEADAIVANLTPFRGPSADAGTVYELGYMAGRGKSCLGYSNDPSAYADRAADPTATRLDSTADLRDEAGLAIENFGLPDNLMIVHALDAADCQMIVARAPPDDIWHDLTAFEACLRRLAGRAAQPD